MSLKVRFLLILQNFLIGVITIYCSYKFPKEINFSSSFEISSSLEIHPTKPFLESKFFIFGKNQYLHFREFKPKQSSVGNILLVHGFSGSTYSFRKNFSKLVELNYLVLAIDLPNFGYSSRIENWNHSNESRAKLLWKFLEFYENSTQMKLKKWVILGHSMGGLVASYMAQISPVKTEKLILVAPALGKELSSFAIALSYFPLLEQTTKLWISKTLNEKEKFAKLLQSAYGIYPFYPLEEEILNYQKPLLLENTVEYSFDLIRNSKNQTPLILNNIQTPVYIIHGLNDTWVKPEDVMQQSKYFSNAKLIMYSKAGHCPMETNFEEFNEDLSKILKSN